LRLAACHAWAGRFSECKVLLEGVEGEDSARINEIVENRLKEIRSKEVADLDFKNGYIN
jgi:hypothetical protein